MTMLKKLITLLLAVALLLPGAALADYGENFQPGTHITVGTVSRLTGNFFTEMWGNNTADMDIRELLHGLSTITWDEEQQYGINANVVRQIKCDGLNEDGSKTYTILLYNNMRFSDGELMSAQDFVFSILLQASPVMAELGVDSSAYSWIVGYEDYHSGKTKEFAGVRYIRHNTFSLTIKAECLPYFYEMVYLKINPYPMHVIAPNCNVADAGKGAYIRGAFNKAMAEKTILDPETGYLSHPKAVAGAYALTSYDAETGTAELKANRYFPGHDDGAKPAIDTITVKHVTYDEALVQLESGELDLLNKATDGSFIDAALQLEGVQSQAYGRDGYGFLAFACEEEEPVTGSQAVRQAMAFCLDQDALVKDFLGDYGNPVYSYYGNALWVAQDYLEQMADLVTVYDFDTDAAVALLEQDGWTLNESGAAFTAGADGVRYKKLADGTLQPLSIRFACTEGSRAAAWIATEYAAVLESVGFRFESTQVGYAEVLSNYYRQTERQYNLMILATNFNYVYDPLYTFSAEEEHQGVYNTSGIVDDELLSLAQAMHATVPGDMDAYKALWVKLMQRYSDVLPTMPLYSNTYYDFCSSRLSGYDIAAHTTWTQAILYARVK